MSEVLTTGWESGLPAEDSLTRRFVLAYADRITAMAERTGGRQAWAAGARMVDLRSPFGYDNAVVVTRPLFGDEWTAVLDAAGAFYPPDRWWVLLSVFPTPGLAGLVPVGHPPLMLRVPAPFPPAPSGLEIRPVRDATTLADFEAVLVEAYGLAEVGAPAIADLTLAGSLLHLRVGYVDGRPVATAGSAVHHGVVEVDWVASVVRRRGYGAALTAAVAGVAPELPSVLIASDDGHGVYRRLGYLDLFRTTMWEHPPS
ncbi:GNAT family N-acetyltransferase [Actinomycetospora soli]|uniref:GNAT family N-acetyltransferase n=1 Tax=Actinomycetospora soli TaxID=2893887 RepID=UPI001E5CC245|nr:N-acetyltransferase [Actinomycetospora soli]MCD2186793.1 N-acetyltransferase [Actinomycetospora soli]